MRLINVKTVEIEYFPRSTPPYAILSHTWNKGQEVTFQMMQGSDLKYQQLSGWTKIQQCCNQAREDGWEYAWVDTCCIDKKNSVELNEAINSMFAYYRNAVVCYTYLDDHHSTSQEIAGCRWFTRGWTLQELIAPLSMFFFNSSWTEIGSRDSLALTISEAANISVEYLTQKDLFRSASVAEKLSWAARRSTERLEDEAYCLLGLFDTYMPLIYGEQEKAFERLQKAILEVQDDETIFAWLFTNKLPENIRGSMAGFLAQSPSQFKDCSGLVPAIYDNSRNGMLLSKGGLRVVARLHRFVRGLSYDEALVLNIAHVENRIIPRYLMRIRTDSTARGSSMIKAVSPAYDSSGLGTNCHLRVLHEGVPGLCFDGATGLGRVTISEPAEYYYQIASTVPRRSTTKKMPVNLFVTAHGLAIPSSIFVANGSDGNWAADLSPRQASQGIACGNAFLREAVDNYMFVVSRLRLVNGERLDIAIGLHWKGLVDSPSYTIWRPASESLKKDSFERLKKDLVSNRALGPRLCTRGLQIKVRAHPVPAGVDTSEPPIRVHLAINEV